MGSSKYSIDPPDALLILSQTLLAKTASDVGKLIGPFQSTKWPSDGGAAQTTLTLTRCRRRLFNEKWDDCWKVEYGTSTTALISETAPIEVGIVGDMMRTMIWPSQLEVVTRLRVENDMLRARIKQYEDMAQHYGHNLVDVNRAVKQANNALQRFRRL